MMLTVKPIMVDSNELDTFISPLVSRVAIQYPITNDSALFDVMLIMIFALETLTLQRLNPLALPHVWETQCPVSLDMSGLDK
jgi:hypothetical protein